MESFIPNIGFGTWRLEGKEAQQAVSTAIETGYRLIDTAAAYGNEVSIKKVFPNCVVPRSDLLISGKLWNTKRKYEDALVACKQSLKRLGLQYFDLYLVHWPASPALYPHWREINAECWRAMETLQQEGTVRHIGVCNFLPHHLEELRKTACIFPEVNQIEFHPGFYNLETLQYCANNQIRVEAWSPLGEGSLLQHPFLVELARAYRKTSAQICLRWCVQHGTVPLPRSSNPQRMAENFGIFDFEIVKTDMDRLDAMPFSGGSGFDPDTITIYG